MPDPVQQDFEADFERAVAEWRARHRLAEDDAVLLLVELFRIHQRHWDDLRRRDLPSFEQFRGDIAKLSELAGDFKNEVRGLNAGLHSVRTRGSGLSRPLAVLAALMTGLAGYLLGRVGG